MIKGYQEKIEDELAEFRECPLLLTLVFALLTLLWVFMQQLSGSPYLGCQISCRLRGGVLGPPTRSHRWPPCTHRPLRPDGGRLFPSAVLLCFRPLPAGLRIFRHGFLGSRELPRTRWEAHRHGGGSTRIPGGPYLPLRGMF